MNLNKPSLKAIGSFIVVYGAAFFIIPSVAYVLGWFDKVLNVHSFFRSYQYEGWFYRIIWITYSAILYYFIWCLFKSRVYILIAEMLGFLTFLILVIMVLIEFSKVRF